MSDLVWKKSYNIGHFQIDQEHRELVTLANKVIHLSDKAEDVTEIQRAVTALAAYVKRHFYNEERYMARIGYKEIDRHKACHADLISRLNVTVTQADRLDRLVRQLKRLMVVWVIEHIIHEDRKIAPHP